MSETLEDISITLFSELFMADQLARALLGRALPKGMELSHFSVLNHLARSGEKSPGQLARSFHVTGGAMTNTLAKLEYAGYVHVRRDWDDARRKFITISPAGRRACELAFQALAPSVSDLVRSLGSEKLKTVLPILREIRLKLDQG